MNGNNKNLKISANHSERKEEAKRFCLMVYAKEAIQRIDFACKYILENKLDNYDLLRRCLVAAIYTMYAKAFSKNNGVGQLNKILIPKELIPMHEAIIYFRNKVHAHTHANAEAKGTFGNFGVFNQVILQKTPTQIIFGGSTLEASDDEISNIRILCKALDKKLHYYIMKFQTKHLTGIKKLNNGDYVVNIDDSKLEIFEKRS
jgi:hypothetical protein